MQQKTCFLYEKKGQMAGGAVSNIITLIVGVGVAVLVLIFVGSLGGQTYELVQDDINSIGVNASNLTDGNFTIRNSINNAIVSSFDALEQTGSYLPIIVLAVVIALVLALVLGFTAFGTGGGSGRAL